MTLPGNKMYINQGEDQLKLVKNKISYQDFVYDTRETNKPLKDVNKLGLPNVKNVLNDERNGAIEGAVLTWNISVPVEAHFPTCGIGDKC